MTTDSPEVRALMGGRALRRIVYSADAIAGRVRAMGAEITRAYPPDERLLVIGLLKGSFIFVSDLVREISRPLHVDFLIAGSYGGEMTSSGHVRLLYDPEVDLEGRHVLLVEDIVDSGTTINRLVPLLRERSPRSLELCTLLDKHQAAPLALQPRWVGFDAPDEFLIGYGLDYSENFRNLPFIASL